MDYNFQEAVTTLLGALLAYVGYRGKKMEERIEANHQKSAEQDVEIAKVTTEVTSIKEEQKEIGNKMDTMSFDIKEILRYLRGK